jgi:hypothetical protein
MKARGTEMRELRAVEGHTGRELKKQSAQNKVTERHRQNWINRVDRTDARISKQSQQYITKESRDEGRPWERWKEYTKSEQA